MMDSFLVALNILYFVLEWEEERRMRNVKKKHFKHET